MNLHLEFTKSSSVSFRKSWFIIKCALICMATMRESLSSTPRFFYLSISKCCTPQSGSAEREFRFNQVFQLQRFQQKGSAEDRRVAGLK